MDTKGACCMDIRENNLFIKMHDHQLWYWRIRVKPGKVETLSAPVGQRGEFQEHELSFWKRLLSPNAALTMVHQHQEHGYDLYEPEEQNINLLVHNTNRSIGQMNEEQQNLLEDQIVQALEQTGNGYVLCWHGVDGSLSAYLGCAVLDGQAAVRSITENLQSYPDLYQGLIIQSIEQTGWRRSAEEGTVLQGKIETLYP